MIAAMPINALEPTELWSVLEEHNLLSSALMSNPGTVGQMSGNAVFKVLHDGDNPLGLLLEFRNAEPGVIDVLLIPHDRGLGKRREEIAELGLSLRNEWFLKYGLRRVQSYVPASRVNVQRFLRAIGFVEETRRGVGLRSAVSFGKAPEAMLVYGLLPDDPVKVWSGNAELAHNGVVE